MKPLELWMPTADAGAPVACLATSFTFDADFFDRDCLSRFLGLTATFGEGGAASDLALAIEMEERLAEASVAVVVDRSYRPEPRNLRWDLLPVAVPGALLHAKTVVLVWENLVRLVVGSANLTPAGYRRQVEMVAGFDITEGSADIPAPVARELLTEITRIVELAPPECGAARSRALGIVADAQDRIDRMDPPASIRGVRMAVSPSGDGRSALDGFDQVWVPAARPRLCRALSPFWDSDPDPPNGVAAIASADRLSPRRRDGKLARLELIVSVGEVAGAGTVVRAPEAIRQAGPPTAEVTVRRFVADNADRRLHAKWLEYRDDDWVAVMFGSSNLTAKGVGLARQSHRELNLWIGAERTSPIGKRLQKLVTAGDVVDPAAVFEPDVDEDEIDVRPLPLGFVSAVISGPTHQTVLRLDLHGPGLPREWEVTLPGASAEGRTILGTAEWSGAEEVEIPFDGTVLPTCLDVSWIDGDGVARSATWAVNVDDPAHLPPPSELKDLPVDALLTVLASTRPIWSALAVQFATLLSSTPSDITQVDPLERHRLTTEALLPRVRHQSAALAGMQARLSRPVASADTLRWRLFGAMSPNYLAERLVDHADDSTWLPGEVRFLLAELALAVRSVTFDVRAPLTVAECHTMVDECIQAIRAAARSVDGAVDGSAGGWADGPVGVPNLDRYVELAFTEAEARPTAVGSR